jgi:hypothetical protein
MTIMLFISSTSAEVFYGAEVGGGSGGAVVGVGRSVAGGFVGGGGGGWVGGGCVGFGGSGVSVGGFSW